MKLQKSEIHRNYHVMPEIRTESAERKSLTSYSGLFIFLNLFNSIDLRGKLKRCFAHVDESGLVFDSAWTTLFLTVHLILGMRYLRDVDFYRNDPVVERVLGVTQIPDASTLSRRLKEVDSLGVDNVQDLLRDQVIDRLVGEYLKTVTIDFDGSVQSTKRLAEGTAVGFNKKKKGQRSYYPLFATVAQTSQFLDMLHRSGNVHDSNGSEEFVKSCIQAVKEKLPYARLEARFDSAFFFNELLDTLAAWRIEFSVTVPFHRFVGLKELIEKRQRWNTHNDFDYFELDWGPESWMRKFRTIVVRTLRQKQLKGPLQLDFFEPLDYDYEYQVIMTNKTSNAKKVSEFHNGRGAQEGIFAEAKSNISLGHIPVTGLNGNRLYCIASMLAHNLNHELQIRTAENKDRGTTEKRSANWIFRSLETIRKNLIQRAGRLIRPQGKLTLVIGANEKIHDELIKHLAAA